VHDLRLVGIGDVLEGLRVGHRDVGPGDPLDGRVEIVENLADKARGLGVPVWRVVAMRNLSRLLGLLIPVLRQLCDGKCPIEEPRISRRSEEGLSGTLTRRPD